MAVGTDIGNVRSENQDRTAVLKYSDDKNGQYLVGVICDGMGGMSFGSECASLAISSFLVHCYKFKNLSLDDCLFQATLESNKAVFNKYQGSGGATLSAFITNQHGEIRCVNVGDSRIYRHNGYLEQLTIDDTIAGHFNQKVENEDHLGRNDLLQYIGVGSDLHPNLIQIETLTNSFYLLTTDGIHYLPKELISLISHHEKDPALIVRRLIEISKWCGGRDNASAMVVRPFELSLINTDSDPMVLEVWDAFGEIRLVDFEMLFEKTQFKKPSPPVNVLSEKPIKTIPLEKPKRINQQGKKSKAIKQKRLPLESDDSDNQNLKGNEPAKLIVEFNKDNKSEN